MDKKQFQLDAKSFIDHTISHLQKLEIGNGFYEAIQAISKCKGIVITTGMGKNNHIAKKVSSTFSSLKIPSCSMHPGEALHGDAGVIKKNDILLVFSTSGKTDEIIKTIEVARELGVARVISLTSHLDSPIRRLSDIVVDVGEIKEAGYLGLAPTTSTLILLLAGDILATFSAKIKKVTTKDYSARHHSGYLGALSRKLTGIKL